MVSLSAVFEVRQLVMTFVSGLLYKSVIHLRGKDKRGKEATERLIRVTKIRGIRLNQRHLSADVTAIPL